MRSPLLPFLALAPILAAPGCSRDAGAEQAADPLAFLQLDGGKRWLADDHTRNSIAAMAAAMQAAAGDESPGRTRALGRQLQDLGDLLLQGCTMTGPAHDALHGYLGVLLPDVGRMASDDAAVAAKARAEVASVLARFGSWFA